MNKVPLKVWASLLGALLYGASPIDLLPDVIPLLGLMDDAAIIPLFLLMAVFHLRKSRATRLKPIPVTLRR